MKLVCTPTQADDMTPEPVTHYENDTLDHQLIGFYAAA